MKKMFSPNYQGGKCPFGYEYVNAYSDRNRFVDSYCRKVPKFRAGSDPLAREHAAEEKRESEAAQRAIDAINDIQDERDSHFHEGDL